MAGKKCYGSPMVPTLLLGALIFVILLVWTWQQAYAVGLTAATVFISTEYAFLTFYAWFAVAGLVMLPVIYLLARCPKPEGIPKPPMTA